MKFDLGLPAFCSRPCKTAWDTRLTRRVACATCGKLTKRNGKRMLVTKAYCSYRCMGLGRKTGKTVECAECGHGVYVSGHRLRRHSTYFCSNVCRLKRQYRNNFKAWAGFVASSTEYRKMVDRLRKSKEVVAWKKAVIARDGACTGCLEVKDLHAHHVIPLITIVADNDFTESRVLVDPRLTDVSNGKTLCHACHAKQHLQSS